MPSGSLIILAPIYDAFGLPAAGIGLLLAVDLVPDVFVTVANVTADMTVVAVLSRPKGGARSPRPDLTGTALGQSGRSGSPSGG